VDQEVESEEETEAREVKDKFIVRLMVPGAVMSYPDSDTRETFS
jgi:hypothetical protein